LAEARRCGLRLLVAGRAGGAVEGHPLMLTTDPTTLREAQRLLWRKRLERAQRELAAVPTDLSELEGRERSALERAKLALEMAQWSFEEDE
jgi:hypothetical protein